MVPDLVIPAAQYLRMSTEHQQYSLENQSSAIQKYAESRGFEVVRTYSDAAKSGLGIQRRPGLRQLLQDVVGGVHTYSAILVYDVSRWGRFQDTDESAHYEFLCKSAGVPVHYCAETFANDGTLPSLIMKALKRTMAGEYSRELGVKVLAGQKRLAGLGFKQGGPPGYGLRRMLVSADRQPKQPLDSGERKSLATDRVILVPGPNLEVQIVRAIFRMLLTEKMSVYAIARRLNHRGTPYVKGSEWDYQAVYAILTQPKYAGHYVYGRTSSRLYTPTVRLPRSEWVVTSSAIEPIIAPSTFEAAQQILRSRTIHRPDDALLEALKTLLARKGQLSLRVIQDSPLVPSPSTYRRRFGSLRRAYELIGYGHSEDFGPIDLRSRTRGLRDHLISEIVSLFPCSVSIVRPGGRQRTRLQIETGLIVSVLVARCIRVWKETIRWQVDPVQAESGYVTLLARLGYENRSFMDFHVLPNMDRRTRFVISRADAWLHRGLPLNELASFREVVCRIGSTQEAKGSLRS
jgi:DNA invertase Pin-like site-specific DNA recombinase